MAWGSAAAPACSCRAVEERIRITSSLLPQPTPAPPKQAGTLPRVKVSQAHPLGSSQPAHTLRRIPVIPVARPLSTAAWRRVLPPTLVGAQRMATQTGPIQVATTRMQEGAEVLTEGLEDTAEIPGIRT